jgi:hypothetical protein
MATARDSDTRVGKADLDTFCLSVKRGQKVQITAGILQGAGAVVVRQRTGGRVLVRLQRGAYVEIHQYCLEPK